MEDKRQEVMLSLMLDMLFVVRANQLVFERALAVHLSAGAQQDLSQHILLLEKQRKKMRAILLESAYTQYAGLPDEIWDLLNPKT